MAPRAVEAQSRRALGNAPIASSPWHEVSRKILSYPTTMPKRNPRGKGGAETFLRSSLRSELASVSKDAWLPQSGGGDLGEHPWMSGNGSS